MKNKVTFSCGIAKWEKGWSAKNFFDYADEAMYFSKATGKNKTTVYQLK